MALEPLAPTLETGPNRELADMTRRFWIALAFALPVMVLAMGGHLPGARPLAGGQAANWLEFALASPAVIWAGWPLLVRGWNSVYRPQSQHVHADRHGHGGRLGL